METLFYERLDPAEPRAAASFNQVLWPNALAGNGAVGDLRVAYTKAGLEADVILGPNAHLPPPSAFGLSDENSLIQVVTEWVGDTPEASQDHAHVGRPDR